MTTLMNWLMALLVASLASVTILITVLAYRTQTRWMKIFSEQHGIPAVNMELKPAPREVVELPTKKKVKAFSMPIPGAQMFKSK